MQKLVDVSSCGKTTTNLGSCEHTRIGQNINMAISDLNQFCRDRSGAPKFQAEHKRRLIEALVLDIPTTSLPS